MNWMKIHLNQKLAHCSASHPHPKHTICYVCAIVFLLVEMLFLPFLFYSLVFLRNGSISSYKQRFHHIFNYFWSFLLLFSILLLLLSFSFSFNRRWSKFARFHFQKFVFSSERDLALHFGGKTSKRTSSMSSYQISIKICYMLEPYERLTENHSRRKKKSTNDLHAACRQNFL